MPVAGAVLTNVCEHGDHPAPDGQRFCSAACQRCEATEHDATVEECAGICTREREQARTPTRHDWTCAPWNAPYGIAWTCSTCGTVERVSCVVLSDPERVASMAVALRSACSGRAQRALPLPPVEHPPRRPRR